LPYAGRQIQRLITNLVRDLNRDGRVRDVFTDWANQAHDVYESYRPDLVVGISLGGALAMRLDSGTTPQVLMAPPWSGRFDLTRFLGDDLPPLVVDWAVPLLCRFVTEAAAIPSVIKPATLIVHSGYDDVVPIEGSHELMARNPARSDAERDYFTAVEHALI